MGHNTVLAADLTTRRVGVAIRHQAGLQAHDEGLIDDGEFLEVRVRVRVRVRPPQP